MKHIRLNIIAGAAALIAASAAAPRVTRSEEGVNHYAIVKTVLETYVVPHVAALQEATARLPEAVEKVCASGSSGAREELGYRLLQSITAYAGVDFLRFGPMLEAGRRERLFFWPDPRGIMGRQMRQVLATPESVASTATAISQQSAAVQGLPALEILMTDASHPLGPSEDGKVRCQLASAIAGNIAAVGRDVAEGWLKEGGWKDRMLRPGSDNETYKEPQEAANEMVKALLTGLQLVADLQLKPRQEAKLKLAGPFEASGNAANYFQASAKALKDFYDALDLERYLPEDKDWMKNWNGGAWRTIMRSNGLGGPVGGAKKADAPPVREVFDKMTGIRKLVAGQLSAAAGLTVGFNELDGD